MNGVNLRKNQRKITRIQTPFNGQSCKFNPFYIDIIAVSTAQNFGIVGKGRQHVFKIPLDSNSFSAMPPACSTTNIDWSNLKLNSNSNNYGSSEIVEICSFNTAEGIMDCAWSESNPEVLACGISDRTILVCKTYINKNSDDCPTKDSKRNSQMNNENSSSNTHKTLSKLTGHTQEVSSLSWSKANTNLCLSSSWDGSVRLWDVSVSTCLRVYSSSHKSLVYQVAWSPVDKNVFASVGADGRLLIYDVCANSKLGSLDCQRGSASCVTASCSSNTNESKATFCMNLNSELLSLDWCRTNAFLIWTGGVEGCASLWDIRQCCHPLLSFRAHKLCVKQIKSNPYFSNIFVTASYDMNVYVWHVNHANNQITNLINTTFEANSIRNVQNIDKFDCHTEFVMSVDWNNFIPNYISSTSWDKKTFLWNSNF